MKVCKDAYVGKVKVNERELEALMENLEFELRCSVNPLFTHVWLRLVRYKLAQAVIVVALVLLFLFLKRGLRPDSGITSSPGLVVMAGQATVGRIDLRLAVPHWIFCEEG